VAASRHLLAGEGCFLAMKGSFPEGELMAIEDLCRIQSVDSILVPGLDEQRHLITMTLR
jgi:16S rRNA (guanine527-N7)-methyltransferase